MKRWSKGQRFLLKLLYKQKLAKETLEASAASKPLRQETSPPGPQQASRLENNNKQFAPVA